MQAPSSMGLATLFLISLADEMMSEDGFEVQRAGMARSEARVKWSKVSALIEMLDRSSYR